MHLEFKLEKKFVIVPKQVGRYHAFPTLVKVRDEIWLACRSGDVCKRSFHGINGKANFRRAKMSSIDEWSPLAVSYHSGANEMDTILSGPFGRKIFFVSRDFENDVEPMAISHIDTERLEEPVWIAPKQSLVKQIGIHMGCFGHIRQSRSQELLMSGLGLRNKSRKFHSPILFSSKDQGRSWRIKSVLAFSEDEKKVLTEFSLTNIDGTQWVALIRNETEPYPLLKTYSANDGATWAPVSETPLLGHAPMLLEENPGYLLVAYRDLSEKLPGVAVGVSLDCGETWQRLGRVADYSGGIYDGGYADICQIAAGRFLIVYYTVDCDASPWIEGAIFSV